MFLIHLFVCTQIPEPWVQVCGRVVDPTLWLVDSPLQHLSNRTAVWLQPNHTCSWSIDSSAHQHPTSPFLTWHCPLSMSFYCSVHFRYRCLQGKRLDGKVEGVNQHTFLILGARDCRFETNPTQCFQESLSWPFSAHNYLLFYCTLTWKWLGLG